jgi:6-phosphogluconolactonase
MNKRALSALLFVVIGLALLTPINSSADNLKSGAVYVLTNQVVNAIAVFNRAPDGTLTAAGMFLTGGAGNPVAQPGDPPTDPLASQGSLILSQNKQLLFAVNAGSNEISVLRVEKSGLVLVDVVSSGGIRPISLTLHDDLLYVLNEGGTPNITGFTVETDGSLTPLAGSTRPLVGGVGADPAQVGFSGDGSLLVVTEKLGNRLDTYTVGTDGLPSAPIPTASNGLTPFGFAFRGGVLVVSEAFAGMPNQGKASSYNAAPSGMLSVISGSVPDFQTAACWVVITNNGKLVFVSNTGSAAISSYQLSAGGALSLIESVAGSTGPGSAPIDMALNNSARYLYVTDNGLQMVHSFAVNKDGTLTPIDNDGGLPFGVQGIAAK